ncbi:MAG: hypothetical protein ACD_77C00211G0001 [uncultured bacterium]|nr:MAG: hypothetical protein ACD_77C00211G0001 [uncultured bacterium]
MSTTIEIKETCSQCEACLEVVTTYEKEWADAVRSEEKPILFNIGTDGYADFENARDECPEAAIEEVG